MNTPTRGETYGQPDPAETLWTMETMRSIREELAIIEGLSALLGDADTRDELTIEAGTDMIVRHTAVLRKLVDELESLANARTRRT